jgi:hypothetical protein
MKIGGQTTAVLSYAGKEFPRSWRFFDFETASPCHFNLDIVPFPELECFHYRSGQSNSQTIPPFSDLHKTPPV